MRIQISRDGQNEQGITFGKLYQFVQEAIHWHPVEVTARLPMG